MAVQMWVVKHTSGSTPMGGRASCEILAVDPMPPILESMPEALPVASLGKGVFPDVREANHDAEDGSRNSAEETWKEDLSGRMNGQQVFLIHNILTPEESNAVIELSELCCYSEAAPDISTPPGMRMNLSSHWVAPRAWERKLFERIRQHLPQEIDGQRLLGLSCRLNMYKYLQNMHFKPHVDGDWPAYAVDDADKHRMVTLDRKIFGHSKLSMLLYLNDNSGITEYDGVEGGSTRLYMTQRGGETCDVSPQKGAALFFRHGFGRESVLHEGCAVGGRTPKYVARINVMYAIDHDDSEFE